MTWQMETNERNLITWINRDKLPYKRIDVANSEFNTHNPKEGFSVFWGKSNQKHFTTREKAIEFVEKKLLKRRYNL